jgi:hypothetical protein
MPVGIRLRFEGGTQEQYEAVHSHMKIDESPPAGLILHSAGPIDGGWGVLDFWESREAFDSFASGRLMPAAGELGEDAFQTPPDIKEFPVHHITKPPA